MEFLQFAILTLGGTGMALTVVAYLGKTVIEHWLTKDVEGFKQKLLSIERESAARLENALQLEAVEHSVRFTRLHERRAEVIQRVYELLVEFMWACSAATAVFRMGNPGNRPDEVRAADEKRLELNRYFAVNRIYLPAEACASLQKLLDQALGELINMDTYLQITEHASLDMQKEKREVLMKAFQFFAEEVRKPMADLEHAFRAILEPKLPDTSRSSTSSP